jgi:tripartite-type tricarboxylate transporter receptor subunit TctC
MTVSIRRSPFPGGAPVYLGFPRLARAQPSTRPGAGKAGWAPSRPVYVVVPLPLGGSADVKARMIAQHLSHTTYGSSGSGSPTHLAGTLLAPITGVTLTHVPYRGQDLALNDLMAGLIQLISASVADVLGQLRGGPSPPSP